MLKAGRDAAELEPEDPAAELEAQDLAVKVWATYQAAEHAASQLLA